LCFTILVFSCKKEGFKVIYEPDKPFHGEGKPMTFALSMLAFFYFSENSPFEG